MFTGIITDLGTVCAVESGGDSRIAITTAYDLETVPIGASIACSGGCLTVVDKGADWFAMDLSAETLGRTTLGACRVGTKINLERPLKVGDEFGGHVVLGHIDGVGRIVGREPVGESVRFVLATPAGLARYIAPKGSIALDGVSLTVNQVTGGEFEVTMIPHTLRSTTFGNMRPGDRVNVEVDVFARYLARMNEEG